MANARHWLIRINQSIHHINHFRKAARGEPESLEYQHAILWNLELISLACRHMTRTFKDEHPEVDWRRLDHLCAQVIGDPWDFDRQHVWQCVREELPPLEHKIRGILNECQIK